MGAGYGCGPRSQRARTDKPVKAAAKTAANSSFGANMPLMSSAFDTAMWLTAALGGSAAADVRLSRGGRRVA